MAENFDQPLDKNARKIRANRSRWDSNATGVVAERIARFTGTPQFLIYLTVFVALWIGWNTLAPEAWRFDSVEIGFTALTLMLSLQASYSAPLILLAQNRQDDRDRVTAQRDRQVAAQNLEDTEYLAREIAAFRIAISEVATRDFIRGELRDVVEDIKKSEIPPRTLSDKNKRIAELEARIAKLEAELHG